MAELLALVLPIFGYLYKLDKKIDSLEYSLSSLRRNILDRISPDSDK